MKKLFLILDKRSLALCVMVILLAFGAVKQTQALDILSDEVWSGPGGNFNRFLVVEFPGWNTGSPIDWDTANSLVTTLGNFHLATITTAEEQTWIANTLMSGLQYEYWIGAYQEPITTTEPNTNWNWVTGEPWSFAYWHTGEPNDNYGPGAEQWAAIWDWSWETPPPYTWMWNDEWPYSYWNIRGFIAESNDPVPEPATMLLLGSGLLALAGYGRKKFFKK